MATELETQRRGIQSVQRAVAALRLLAEARQGMGVSELARALGLPKGTAHGILRTLRLHGMVEQDEQTGRYMVGAALLPIGFAYLATSRLRTAALGPTHALAARCGESVRVGTLHGGSVLIVHHVPGAADGFRALEVGEVVPAHATALGKALLAQASDELPRLVVEGLERYTSETITSVFGLRRELGVVSRRGWATSVGELSRGVASIAAPVGAEVLSSGAIEVDGPAERILEDGEARPELIYGLLECARAIARVLGTPVR